MNNTQRVKRRLQFIPRTFRDYTENEKRPRKSAVYYNDSCCKTCYFGWGRFFEKKHLYKHDSAESNYNGALKQYWKEYTT